MSDYVNYRAQAYPSPLGQMVVLSILTTAPDGFRVYQGIVPDTSIEDPEYFIARQWVMQHGNKASFDAAQKNFPSLSAKEYVR